MLRLARELTRLSTPGPTMNATYLLTDPNNVLSPALLFYKDVIRENLASAIAIAGVPERLRPHVKTHKTREIVRMQLEARVTKHKCATIAEGEMLASCGAKDVLLAYPLVGPNCARLARLVKAFPGCQFSTTADHSASVAELSQAIHSAGQSVDVLLDVDVGQ